MNIDTIYRKLLKAEEAADELERAAAHYRRRVNKLKQVIDFAIEPEEKIKPMLDIVSKLCDVPPAVLLGHHPKTRTITEARLILTMLIRENVSGMSDNRLSKYLKRDHTIIKYRVQKANDLMDVDSKFKALWNQACHDLTKHKKNELLQSHHSRKPHTRS